MSRLQVSPANRSKLESLPCQPGVTSFTVEPLRRMTKKNEILLQKFHLLVHLDFLFVRVEDARFYSFSRNPKHESGL